MRIQRLLKILPVAVCDSVAVAVAALMAWLIHYTKMDPAYADLQLRSTIKFLPILAVGTVAIFYFLGLYVSLWRFAGAREAIRVFAGVFLVTASYILFGDVWLRFHNDPVFYAVFFSVALVLILLIRFFARILSFIQREGLRFKKTHERIMIIGAGEAGSILLSGISTSGQYMQSRVVCVIDDDKTKVGFKIGGVKIVGTRDDIPEMVEKYKVNTILFAIPSCPKAEMQKIMNICKMTGCKLKTLPGVSELTDGSKINQIREVSVEDLLGRDVIKLDLGGIGEFIGGRSVLVTGAGGSIGSELCRQIAKYKPSTLLLLDIYENTTYEIQLELQKKYPSLDLRVHIGSITDERMLDRLLSQYHPEIVFHAAAHKHVPLMEDSPRESVQNNVFGTLALVRACDRFKVKKFVMISTDKAVNPTNVMGATKRICELIIETYDKISETEFVAVRFGNVLGSNGSVIPLFKKQIAAGGPITVTHKDIIRFFMTIPEAVSLVLQAGALARGGEIFVLDMGEPVKILDLAENLIRLSGLRPYEDIDIQFTGLRPGEKLYEELLMDEEGLTDTAHDMIHVGKLSDIDPEAFMEKLEELRRAVADDSRDIRAEIRKVAPTYHPAE